MSLNNKYVCPTDRSLQCSWEGSSGDILEHFIMEHEDLLLHSSEINIHVEVVSENRLLFLNEEIYLIQLKKEEDSLKIGLRYLGPKLLASKISYDIVIIVDDQKYFYNHFDKNASILKIINGYWVVNLVLLKESHPNLSDIQCNLNISSTNVSTENKTISNHNFSDQNGESTSDLDNLSDISDQGTVIKDEEIDDILGEDIKFKEKHNIIPDDGLDTISSLHFSMLENDKHIRRYDSFMGIPQGLFDEKETTNLTCSNCFINMLPPIYMCINNHNICADCRYESCKICYGAVTEIRNKELEDYSRKCLHLCRYHSEGCRESFMYNDIRNHEMKCTYCVFRCIQDCSFTGKFLEFKSHFKIKHSSFRIFHSTPVEFSRNSDFLVQDSQLGIFHCSSMGLKNTIRWVVVFLGPKDRSFSCELTFKGAKIKDVLFLKRLEDQYSLALTKEELKKMKVKEKNAVLTITSYFQ